MKILWLSPSTNNVATFLGSLQGLGEHDVQVLNYDRKWHMAANEMVQQNPGYREEIQYGFRHIPRERCAMDADMLMEAKVQKPDVVIYISAWQGDFVPLNETLGELNSISPTVHFLCDGGDPPWWPQLEEFERRGTFTTTVNIDGCMDWPGGPWWRGAIDASISNGMTLLTPVDVNKFRAPNPLAFHERPYGIGYAGNRGQPVRDALVNRLQSIRGFQFRERDQHPLSYQQFAEFLKFTQVSVNVPFTGSQTARHVKGRVLESGFAGCCLLEWKNEATRHWFTPRAEYFEYESIEECAELAEWLAHHPKIAEETARSLTDRVTKEHGPEVFWDRVLTAAIRK